LATAARAKASSALAGSFASPTGVAGIIGAMGAVGSIAKTLGSQSTRDARIAATVLNVDESARTRREHA
jgi:hypothetical protein